MAHRRVRGNALVLAFGLALVLAIEVYIVTGFSTSNVRLVNRMTSHRRGVYVGDSAFGKLLARMRRTPWGERWFREGPILSTGQSLQGGQVDTWVGDTPGEERTADVWVRASLEQTTAVMFWRVRWREESLELRNLVYPEFFTFLPPDASPPTGAGDDPTLAAVAGMVAEQRANAGAARDLVRRATAHPDFAGLAATVGLVPPGPVRDARPGGAPGSQADYLRLLQAAAIEPVPPPPAVPAPSALAARFPTPLDLPGVLTAVFEELGLPPAVAPTADHFADPPLATAAFAAATALQPGDTRDPRWETRIEHCKIYVVELAKKGSGGCTACRAALNALMAYLAEVTRLEATRRGRAPPTASAVNPYPYDGSGYSGAMTHYREWWIQ